MMQVTEISIFLVTHAIQLASNQLMSRSTDQKIIEEIRAGNSKSFSLLVDRYKHMVYTTAFRFLKNAEEAEEVSQDVFLKAYSSLGGFRGDSKFSTWLYKIAYHKCLDELKRRRTGEITSIEMLPDNYQPAYTDSALEKMERMERTEQIREAILALPGRDSWIVTMFYLEELSLKEIAKITGQTPNAVKVNLFRSREKLFHLLKNRLEPEIIEMYEGRSGKKKG